MNNYTLVCTGVAAALVAANAFVSRRVYKSDMLEPAQKYMQYGLIWIMPVAGALLTYALSREPDPSARARPNGDLLEGAKDGDGTNYSGHHGDD